MIFGLFILFLTIIVLLFSLTLISDKVSVDSRSPLNLAIYQEPKNGYTKNLINHWVDKDWRSDRKQIPCLIERGYADSVPEEERSLIIYSHGNAEDILLCSQFIRKLSMDLKCDVLCWDYSGYGLNDIDSFERSAEGINLSLQTVINSMLSKGYQMKNTIIWGYSLGTGPSIHNTARLCSEGVNQPPKCLILFGAYSSILDVVRDITKRYISKDMTQM